MSWKFKVGQFIGILVGVVTGSFIVNYIIYKAKGSPQPQTQQNVNANQGYPQTQYNQPQPDLFFQAVANSTSTKASSLS